VLNTLVLSNLRRTGYVCIAVVAQRRRPSIAVRHQRVADFLGETSSVAKCCCRRASAAARRHRDESRPVRRRQHQTRSTQRSLGRSHDPRQQPGDN